MAKNLVLILLFCPIFMGFMFRNTPETQSFDITPQVFTECDAPAPDSFRMTSYGVHFVSLAWNPAWPGASHTIKVFKKEQGSAIWSLEQTFPDVTGETFTVQDLKYLSTYKFSIATNCSNGIPSEHEVHTGPPIGVILDLVLVGRTPINPAPKPECVDIFFQNYNWVGFKVESGQSLGGISNYFEFGLDNGGTPLIKRPTNGPGLVAARLVDGEFPKNNLPIVELMSPTFDIRRIVNGLPQPPLGRLDLTYDPILKTVRICKNDDIVWAPGYNFTMMTAQSANGFQGGVFEGLQQEHPHFAELIRVENPVKEVINVFLPNSIGAHERIYISLLNLHGQIIVKRTFNIIENHILFPMETVPPGMYLLRFESLEGIQTFKIVKPE